MSEKLLAACKKAAELGYTWGDLGLPNVNNPTPETFRAIGEEMFELYTQCQEAIDEAEPENKSETAGETPTSKFQCLICAGQLQATLVENHYYNVLPDGTLEMAETSGLDEVRVYCINDCQAEPGAKVCSLETKMDIGHALLLARP